MGAPARRPPSAVPTGCRTWCGGHTVRGVSPVASASTSASGRSPGADDCTGLRAATTKPRAQMRAIACGPPRLAHVGTCPRDEHDAFGVRSIALKCSLSARERDRPRRLVRGDTVTRRREVPGGTVGGRIAVTSSPWSSSAAAASRARRARRRRHRARSGDGCPVGGGRRWRAARAASCRLRGAHDGQRRGGGVGGGRRGGEDVGAGAVHEQVGEARRSGDEATECAERLRQRADPERRSRMAFDVEAEAPRGPRRARAARRAARTRRASSSTGATSPSIENTVSETTTIASAVGGAAEQLVEVRGVGVAERRAPPAEPAAVDDRRVVQARPETMSTSGLRRTR